MRKTDILSYGHLALLCPLRPRFARPPLPEGEARALALLALSVLAALGHLSQRERQEPWLSLPSPSSLRSDTSPRGRGKSLGSPFLALPLGELSPQVTERAIAVTAGD